MFGMEPVTDFKVPPAGEPGTGPPPSPPVKQRRGNRPTPQPGQPGSPISARPERLPSGKPRFSQQDIGTSPEERAAFITRRHQEYMAQGMSADKARQQVIEDLKQLEAIKKSDQGKEAR